MATFTWVPDYAITEQHEPTVFTSKLGGNYEQRLTVGLNNDLAKWPLTFDNRSSAEYNEIMAFLDARKGSESFDWTTPRGLAGKRWKCASWSGTGKSANLNRIEATFEQVAEY
jgi:phage-related protein